VFLKTRTSGFSTRPSRIGSSQSRKPTLDMSGRTPLLSPLRGSRAPSVDHGAAPFEDLRRRLAAINGSTSSLSQTHIHRDNRSSLSLAAAPSSSSYAVTGLPSTLNRPSSPTESVLSTSNSLTFRAGQRLHVGSTDGQKASPAVGSSKTNATGLLEAPSKIHSEGSSERSGRSSPVGTIRAEKQRIPPLLPISTYGSHEHNPENAYNRH
jgi:phosphoinositide-3-kinase regulatory subunit 4